MNRIWDCKCSWVKARKLHGDAPIAVYMGDGSWAEVDWDEVAIHHFVKSPIGLIPPPQLWPKGQLQHACYGMDTTGGENLVRKKQK